MLLKKAWLLWTRTPEVCASTAGHDWKEGKHFFNYSGDPKTEHSNNGTIWLMDYWKFVIQAIHQSWNLWPECNGPFSDQTGSDNSKTEQVHYSDPTILDIPIMEA